MLKPWIEKYRPTKINDIIEQDEVIRVLKNTIKKSKYCDFPNMIFYGPAGCGKTSTILSFVIELFGSIVNERVIELNASDERGINVVRYKIQEFVKFTISEQLPQIKIVILDEADAMTSEAQSALRKIMEDNIKKTRFCFICNYINQIIDPISSRCMKFRFKPISDKSIINKLKCIIEKEGLDISDNIVNIIAKTSKGDARQAIMILQNITYLGGNVKITDLYKVLNIVDDKYINDIWDNICKPIGSLVDIVNMIVNDGYSGNVIIESIIRKVIYSHELDDGDKSNICIKIAEIEIDLMNGGDKMLQLLNCFIYIRAVRNGKKNK